MAEHKPQQQEVKTILVVEDDADIADILLCTFEETPYKVIVVGDGSQALKIVATIKPHLFLLDYYLPAMNGLQLYDQLHSIKGLEDIPTIIMSANLPENKIQQRKITYLKKPFELNDILQMVTTLLK
ncbi:MAG: response regulator [Ktedonobacteraceae bacterium]|nr:response regulator [Ktedonobacteraceae bacterium]